MRDADKQAFRLTAYEDGDAIPTTRNEEYTDSMKSSRATTAENPMDQEPPVSEGDTREVTIENIGSQGDGIARVERGFVVIVPGVDVGDELTVEITDVKDTVAFAEPTA